MSDHFEQLRDPVIRSTGFTASEQHLAALADRTFLNLWAYPNPFRDQKISGGRDGKEVCDLLVVCDPYVLIFSEKNVAWQHGKPIELAWSRWYKRAVAEAAAQLRGAERWLDQFPDKLFLDAECTKPIPLPLPEPDRRILHRVIVANGAKEACRTFFDGGSGSLVLRPDIRGEDHNAPAGGKPTPFSIGDVDPAGDFIHVLDEASLDVVLGELDTITDFTSYLDKRAAFLRSGNLIAAHGEEDLLAYYSIRANAKGEHDFVPPGSKSWKVQGPIVLDGSHYVGLTSAPQYLEKKRANEISYVWDSLIEVFTSHLLGGTSIVLPGFDYSLTNSEVALRHMAQEPRLSRRALSEAFLSALQEGRNRDRFFRMVLWPKDNPEGTAYFFLTLKYLDWMDGQGGYAKYRLVRTAFLEMYATTILIKHRGLERVIGIAMEPTNQGRGSSEDLIFAAQRDWSDEEIDQSARDAKEHGIMRALKMTRHHHSEEYPSVPRSRTSVKPGPNRAERRRLTAIQRKKS